LFREERLEPPGPVQEPTTPQGPPPGPIPMGYLPNPPAPATEPTTPQGPPPGPIPLGYLPSQSTQEGGAAGQEAAPPPSAAQPAPAPEPPAPPPRRSSADPEARKISQEAKEAAARKSSDPNREPQVNVIPIRMEPGQTRLKPEQSQARPASPAPAPAQPPAPATAPTPAPPKDPKIAKLDKIKEEVEELLDKIECFAGTKQDKEYLYLDEMLTRHLIALDGIEPEGQTEIRQLRKESIKSVNRCLSLLDRKVTETSADDNNQILAELAGQSGDKS